MPKKAKSTSKPKAKTAKTTRKKAQKPEKRSLFLFLAKWVFILGIWGFIALLGVIFYFAHDLPDIAKAASFERKRAVTVYASDRSTVIARYGELIGENLSYEDLPQSLINAVLAIEDRRFFSHFGIDPIGVARAMHVNFQKGRIAQGGSTITQQLAKNMFLTADRTYRRKIQEALLALWIEQQYTKKEILAAYLNRVYMGAGAYGVDAASEIYFGKNVSNLTLEESATLAGLLKAPSRYNPLANPKKSRTRTLTVLNSMERHDLLPAEEKSSTIAQKSSAAMIKPAVKPFNVVDADSDSRYFTDWVLESLPAYVGDVSSDLKIYTTLDKDLQKRAVNIGRHHVENLQTSHEDTIEIEHAVIIADKDGNVQAMIGGNDYRESQFNRATQGLRQPGSAFKPIVYLAAIEQGWGVHDLINDDEFSKRGYEPENYNGKFHGDVPLWFALSQSFNVATVRLLDTIGIRPTLDLAKRLGITTNIEPDLSIALGSSSTTLLDMTQVYHTIKSGGFYKPLTGIQEIQTLSGEILFSANEQNEKTKEPSVIPSHQTDQLTLMMEQVIQTGTGQRAMLPYPAAGKTGTSQNNRDGWFLGFTSDYTVGVWVGNDQNKPIEDLYGGTIPAAIWADMIMNAHSGRRGGPITHYEQAAHRGLFDRFWGNITGDNGLHSIDSAAYINALSDYEGFAAEMQHRSMHERLEFRQRPEERQKRRIGNNPNGL